MGSILSEVGSIHTEVGSILTEVGLIITDMGSIHTHTHMHTYHHIHVLQQNRTLLHSSSPFGDTRGIHIYKKDSHSVTQEGYRVTKKVPIKMTRHSVGRNENNKYKNNKTFSIHQRFIRRSKIYLEYL